MDWGTDKVLQQQIEAASVLGLKLKLLSTELNDIVSKKTDIALLSLLQGSK